MLTFANGTIGTIDNSRRAVYGYDQRVEALGSRGGISTANVYPNEVTLSSDACIYRDLPLNFFMDRYVESFASELRAFVEAVSQGAPVPVCGMDGRIPVVMALAAKRSHEEGRPVRLSEVDGVELA
jgi:myo-inositol 2-dehydrogenase/D-chiro-inositol 1-dehydrogenase